MHQEEAKLVAVMDRGKRPARSLTARNNKIYLDLKDIIRENSLPFVPAKSLLRFNAVCRDWRLRISSPFFAHNQSLSCRTASGLFVQARGGSPYLLPIDSNACGVPDPLLRFLPEPVDIMSSSNGLLCCRGHGGDKAYYICNPVTQKWKKIAKSSANHGSDPAIVLVFEPSLLNFEAEYKIICAFQSTDFGEATEFDIYSSKGDSWEVAGEICFGKREVVPNTGVYVNGVVYWKTSSGILTFDLRKERSQHLQSYYETTAGVMGCLSGKLCKANVVSGNSITVSVLDNVHINTMQMGSKGSMWANKERISLAGKTVREVLCVDSGVVVFQSGEKTYSHEFRSRTTKELNGSLDCCNMRCLPYVNSLVSL